METTYFDTIDHPDKAYWLGFLTADGSITCDKRGIYRLTLALQKSDAAHVYRLEKDLGGKRRPRYEENAARLHWYSKAMVSRLLDLGIIPRKSYTPEMPMPHFPNDFERDFWRGLFDGDGCLTTQQKASHLLPEYRFSLAGNVSLLEGFQEWGERAAGMRRQKIGKAKNQHGESGTFVFYMNGNRQIAAVLHALYDNSSRFLIRKHELYLALLKQNAFCGNRGIKNRYRKVA